MSWSRNTIIDILPAQGGDIYICQTRTPPGTGLLVLTVIVYTSKLQYCIPVNICCCNLHYLNIAQLLPYHKAARQPSEIAMLRNKDETRQGKSCTLQASLHEPRDGIGSLNDKLARKSIKQRHGGTLPLGRVFVVFVSEWSSNLTSSMTTLFTEK